MAGIDGLSCLQADFTSTVSHKGFPFGLTKNTLTLTKNNCELIIEHQKLKFMKKKWLVDVCRAPVHIKSGASEIEVIKKKFTCKTDAKSKNDDFCKTLVLMEQILQDDGLIFAKGEKENISSEHGKMYCTYVLLRSYLRFDKILSRTDSKLKFDFENPLNTMVEENIEITQENVLPEVENKSVLGVSHAAENGIEQNQDSTVDEGANPASQNTETPVPGTIIPTKKEIGTF